jgi:hypothetical protein
MSIHGFRYSGSELLKTCRTDLDDNPQYSTMYEGLSAEDENGKTLLQNMVHRLESCDYGHGSENALIELRYDLAIRVYDGTTNKWVRNGEVPYMYVNGIHYDWLKPNVDEDEVDTNGIGNIGCVHERGAINVALFEQEVAELA